ncbi:PQQ-binding-like beta-propeller repeat protein, partial [Kitasatospora sp. MBT63]|uniref:outer membrane protein assembly factor BamB family protein n=1 Tax=Kitasatospora sp. MBT63 TaxID=1444768 RepID=UPI00053B07E3
DRAKAAAASAAGAANGSGEQAPSRRALAIRVGAGVAALAVLVTAGVLVTGEDDPAKPAADAPVSQNIAVAHDKAWAAQPATAAPDGSDDTLAGSWLLADAVVRADGSGVHAYGLADGKATWTLQAPADGAVPCGLSPSVNAKGLGAVLFRAAADPKLPCTTLAAVDTKTGKAVWTKAVSDTKDAYAAHVAVTDDKVIAVGDDRAAAWAAEDGKDVWQYAGQGKFCTLSGGAGGATVVLHSSCADSTPVDQAVALNAADGKVTWWRGLNNQPKTVTVLSAEPAVVLTTGEKPADDRVFAWGPSGDPAAEIPVAAESGRLEVARGTFDAVPGVYFHEHTMIAAVTPADPAGAPAVAAYDLTTGKSVWRTPVAEKRKSRPVGLDGSGLLLAVDERLDQPAHISRFALTGGQETQGGAFPPGTGSLLTSGRLLAGGEKVVAMPEHAFNFGVATAFRSKG